MDEPFDDDRGAPPPKTLQRVRYTHDAVIDTILANPSITQVELCRVFGYSENWMSIIVNSDAFKARLAERKAELIDPKIQASIEQRLEAIAKTSLNRLMDRLEMDNGRGIRTADLVAIAKLGVGDRNNRPAVSPYQQNNLYVVNLPPKAPDSSTWLQQTKAPAPQFVTRVDESL